MTLMKKTGTDMKKPSHRKDGNLGENTVANMNSAMVPATLRPANKIDMIVLVFI
jgi:hypothetical protein